MSLTEEKMSGPQKYKDLSLVEYLEILRTSKDWVEVNERTMLPESFEALKKRVDQKLRITEEKTTEVDWEKKYKDLVKKFLDHLDSQDKMIRDHMKKYNR